MGTDLDQFSTGKGNTGDASFTGRWPQMKEIYFNKYYDGRVGWEGHFENGARQIFCKRGETLFIRDANSL